MKILTDKIDGPYGRIRLKVTSQVPIKIERESILGINRPVSEQIERNIWVQILNNIFYKFPI
jgi:hypothetical protein